MLTKNNVISGTVHKKKQNNLYKNAILNGIRSLSSIVFPFISFSYVSRILGSANIGAYSFSKSIISYALLLAGLGISNYAIREGAQRIKNKKELSGFINEVFSINVISTIISYLLLTIAIILVPRIYADKTIVLILSLQILLTTIGTDWINSIFEDYLYLTIRYIIVQIISLLSVLLLVKTQDDTIAYTLIMLFSTSFGYILNIFYLRRNQIHVKMTKHLNIKKHLKPILILFANSIASIIYLNSDITMIGFMLDDVNVGIYTASTKIYSLSKSLINSIIIVTLPRFSSYIHDHKEQEYKKALGNVFSVLFMVTIPMALLLFLKSREIITLMSGDEYIAGQSVVQILSFAIIFAVFACYFSYSILIPNKKEKKFLIATVSAALINIILNLLFISPFGINAAAATTLCAEIVVFAITLIAALKCIKFNVDIKEMTKVVISSTTLIIVNYIFRKLFGHSDIPIIVVEMVLDCLLYMLALHVFKCKALLGLREIIKGNK